MLFFCPSCYSVLLCKRFNASVLATTQRIGLRLLVCACHTPETGNQTVDFLHAFQEPCTKQKCTVKGCSRRYLALFGAIWVRRGDLSSRVCAGGCIVPQTDLPRDESAAAVVHHTQVKYTRSVRPMRNSAGQQMTCSLFLLAFSMFFPHAFFWSPHGPRSHP